MILRHRDVSDKQLGIVKVGPSQLPAANFKYISGCLNLIEVYGRTKAAEYLKKRILFDQGSKKEIESHF